MEYLAWIEESAFSTWMRESSWALFAMLIVHTLALGLAVGINIVLAARILGLGRTIDFSNLQLFAPLLYGAMWVVLASGLMLLLAYPAKALTNWVFYFKLLCVAGALFLFRHFQRRMRMPSHEGVPALFAVCSLLLWFAAVSAGRFLAYTHSVLLASFY